MKVPDKDMDQLFSSKLKDMEMEPSAMVWDNITAELDEPAKDRKSEVPFMRIAAGIVVIMGISLFFIRPNSQKLELHVANQPGVTGSVQTTGTSAVALVSDTGTTETAWLNESVKHQKNRQYKYAIKTVSDQPDTASRYVADVAKPVTNEINDTPAPNVIAQQGSQASVVNDPVLPKYTPAKQSDLIAANNPTNQKVVQPAKHKKIHSLGDLLNVVIAQVDKRKDKFIEFTNDDDNDSFNVTGLNLGVVKAKVDK